MSKVLHRYLERHADKGQKILEKPHHTLKMVVVIPCYDEPNITTVFNSLLACDRPTCGVEVLLVINASETAAASVLRQNDQSVQAVEDWKLKHPELPVYILCFNTLAKKHAGVGMARKLGMDEALHRLILAGQDQGVIISLDADCRVNSLYLQDIENYFRHKKHACVIPFSHQVEGLSAVHVQAIRLYELEIHYHVQGLRFAKYPQAFHTLGSCFAVSAQAYAAQGGMNRRQAGEDFYFLHKMAELGAVGTLKEACVYPLARLSFRVPFGTGQTLHTWMREETQTRMVTDPSVYQDLAQLFGQLDLLFTQDIVLPVRLSSFLAGYHFTEHVADMRQRVSNKTTFKKRFLRWISALRLRQYSNACHATLGVEKAATALLHMQGIQADEGLEALLYQYRTLHGLGDDGRS